MIKGARIIYVGGEGARGIDKIMPKPNASTISEMEQYLNGDAENKYVMMEALGYSKYFGVLWVKAISQEVNDKAQTPHAFGVKYADALMGKYGSNGDFIGAPEGKAIGELQSQGKMHEDFTNQEKIEFVGEFINKVY